MSIEAGPFLLNLPMGLSLSASILLTLAATATLATPEIGKEDPEGTRSATPTARRSTPTAPSRPRAS